MARLPTSGTVSTEVFSTNSVAATVSTATISLNAVAVASSPEEVCVDAERGDDERGDGTGAKPFRTIARAACYLGVPVEALSAGRAPRPPEPGPAAGPPNRRERRAARAQKKKRRRS